MPPKRPPPADVPPPSPSTGEEEEDKSYNSAGSDEGEDESESDDQPIATAAQRTPQPKPSPAAPPPRPQSTALKADVSSSDDESEESGGEDSDVTPVAAAESKGTRPPPSKKLKLVEDIAKTPPKKPIAGADEESSKKQPFQRLWSEEDEITFLEGMIEFFNHGRIDPSTNMNSFYEFIKDRLELDVVPKQLVNKMKNCKKKLINSEARASNGKNRGSMTPNELRIHELSKKLWDPEDGILKEKSALKSNQKKNPTPIANRKASPALFDDSPSSNAISTPFNEGSLSRLLDGRVDGSFLKTRLESINKSKREEFEKKWEDLNLAELQVVSDRARLIHDATNMLLDAYEKS